MSARKTSRPSPAATSIAFTRHLSCPTVRQKAPVARGSANRDNTKLRNEANSDETPFEAFRQNRPFPDAGASLPGSGDSKITKRTQIQISRHVHARSSAKSARRKSSANRYDTKLRNEAHSDETPSEAFRRPVRPHRPDRNLSGTETANYKTNPNSHFPTPLMPGRPAQKRPSQEVGEPGQHEIAK